MMDDLKKKVEALLFSSGNRMSFVELAKLCKRSPEEVKKALEELQSQYHEKKSSLIIVNDGEFWKLTTKEDYLHLVKNIVTKTELTKTLMETLAVIAFKYPVKQSDLIKIRTNKAYDHLKELEETGYISRQKYGRSKLIKLTPKFFDYFSLPEDKLKEKFKDFEGLAEAIESKEDEIHNIKKEQKKNAEKVGLVNEKGEEVSLEVVDSDPKEETIEEKPKLELYGDKLGGLEVIEEPEIKEEVMEQPKEEVEEPTIEVPDEINDKVDERVNEILGLTKEDDNSPEEMSAVDKKIEELLHPKDAEPEKLHEIDKEKWGRTEEKNNQGLLIKDNEEEPKDLLDAHFEEKNKDGKSEDYSDNQK
ncbi:MAG: SMC-Scp complex subunit ScpB [Nanoarchaeota archaeon]